MIKLIAKQMALAVTLCCLVSACQKSESTGSGSSLMSLEEMLDGTTTSGSSTTGSTSSESSTSGQCQSGQPPAPPDISACATDAATYCSQYPFPTAPTASTSTSTPPPPPDPGLVPCLKTNLASLSSACQTEIEALPANPPPPPPQGGQGQPPQGQQSGGPGQGNGVPPQGPPPGNGGGQQNGCDLQGYSFLGPCNADATTYCSSVLPTRSAFSAMTLEQQLQALTTIVGCLQTNESSVSEACQTALGSATTSSSSSN